MAKKQKQKSVADQFSDPEMEQIQRFGEALHGGVTPFDEEVEHHLERRAREASAAKMKAAQTGGTALGPSEFEQKEVQQQGALEQQMTTQGAAQGAQARAQQTSVTPPAAPAGPQGTTVPYAAQKGAIGPQKGAAGAQMPPPSAPGPEEAPEEGQVPENP
jgi:hypothetical protein